MKCEHQNEEEDDDDPKKELYHAHVYTMHGRKELHVEGNQVFGQCGQSKHDIDIQNNQIDDQDGTCYERGT